MMRRYDAIVIGGGLNGLVSAAYLARGGLNVLLLERNAALGSVDAGFEIAPGFHLPRFKLAAASLPAQIVIDLGLARHGLRYMQVDGEITLFADDYLANYRNGFVHRRELARFSPRDAAAWTGFRRHMLHAARKLEPLLRRRMTNPGRRSPGAMLELLKSGRRIGEMAPADLSDLTRLWTQSCAEFLDAHFESAAVKAHLAGAAMRMAALGPKSPTTARFLMAPYIGEAGDASGGAPAQVQARGGADAVMSALSSVITAHGGSIRTEAEVTDILLRGGRACGVVLADGEEIFADAVLSDLDVKRTFLSLMPWKALPADFVEQVARFRMSGTTAKINLALDQAPDFPGIPVDCPALPGGIRLASSIEEMDRAFDDWRDGIPPRTPLIELRDHSLQDRSLAPKGQHVMSVQIQYVPENLHDGAWTEERKAALYDLVLTRLEMHSPGLKERIVASELLVPSDIENETGVTSGDFQQGEVTLDQMFFNRPFSALSEGMTPVGNLYLCSDSMHPGSLATGSAGANAAALLLSEKSRRK